MKHFIFLTTEGHTFQLDSDSPEPNIENCQMIGTASGETAKQAFYNLLEENHYLKDTNFDELFSFRLAENYREMKEYFFLSDFRKGYPPMNG